MAAPRQAPKEAAGLYVHVPYCHTRCRYCDFYSRADAPSDALVAALLHEARLGAAFHTGFDTLYVGGGTPSVLGPDPLGALVEGARALLPVDAAAEITVELNPDDVDAPLLDVLAQVGVNRISLGVQSFQDRALRWLGRRHDARRARRALRRVREAGFADLAVDLIFGWPGQELRDWVRDLDEALGYSPSHLSCYELTLEPGTPLQRDVAQGREARFADEERSRALYLASAERLRERGWDHYEVSNFACDARHRSRHNGKYWRHVPYLGLGPSAHSLRGRRTRWWNLPDLDGYLRAARVGAAPPRDSEILDDASWRLETVMLGFRTAEGVAESTLAEVPEAEDTVETLVGQGWVVRSQGRVRPTLEGFLRADALPLHFAL